MGDNYLFFASNVVPCATIMSSVKKFMPSLIPLYALFYVSQYYVTKSASSLCVGLTYFVYPGAVHSRFEHSLGVYWLASDAINRLKASQVRLYSCFAIILSMLLHRPFIVHACCPCRVQSLALIHLMFRQ